MMGAGQDTNRATLLGRFAKPKARSGDRPVVLRATGRRLDANDAAKDGPVWVQVALEGEYHGHASGTFELDEKVFADIVRNFRAHPSYRAENEREPWVEGQPNINSGRVIPWDFHHANEAPPTEVARKGAPAQGWVLELDVREGEAGLELWALTDWLPLARQYIRDGSYQWASIAIWWNQNDPVTNAPIGTYMSSVALTNDPFIQGMRPIAASRRGRDFRKLESTLSFEDARRLVGEAIEALYPPGPSACVYVVDLYDTSAVFEWEGRLYQIPYSIAGTTVTLGGDPVEVVRTYSPVASKSPADPATARRTASRSTIERSSAMAHVKVLQRLGVLLAVSQAALLSAREEDPVAVATLEAAVVAAAEDKMAQLKALLAQMAEIVGSMGVQEGAPPAATAARVAELVQAEAELKKLQPEIAKLREEQAKAEEAAISTDVDAALAAHDLADVVRPALLFMRRSDKKAFFEKYPASAAVSATTSHLAQSIVTLPGAPGGQAHALSAVSAAPLGGPAAGGAVTRAQVEAYPGRNLTEKCIAFVSEKHKGLSPNDIQFQASQLRRQFG